MVTISSRISILNISEDKYKPYYIDGRFCPAIRGYLNEIQSQVILTPEYLKGSLRINNKAIMDDRQILSIFTEVQENNLVHMNICKNHVYKQYH